jgi:hypothetical protein
MYVLSSEKGTVSKLHKANSKLLLHMPCSLEFWKEKRIITDIQLMPNLFFS